MGVIHVKRNTIHLPPAHSWQQQMYLDSLAPITACAWGTKAGKTFGSTEWQVRYAWLNGGGDTQPHWWVAPIYRQAKIAVRLMRQFLPNDPSRIHYIKTENRIEIKKTNGEIHAAIEFRSADDPDALQGDGVKSVVVDEADRMKRESWESLLTTLTKTKAPCRVISSPKRRAWFWELCKKGMSLTPDQARRLVNGDSTASPDGVYYMNCPTSINPYVDPAQIERMRHILPDRAFRCYYLAEFPDSDGIVFTGLRRVFIEKIMFEDTPKPGELYIAALDLARHGDWTQLVIGSATRRQIVKIMRWKDQGWEISWRKALSYAEQFNMADIIVDATTGSAGDPILESMQSSGTGCHVEGFDFKGHSKQPLIENLILGTEKGDYRIPYEESSKYAYEEMEVYEFDISAAGNIKYGAPEGQHDDFVTALALWYRHLTSRVMPGIRIYTSDHVDKKELINASEISDEAIANLLKIEESKWKKQFQDEARARLALALHSDDDD